ncbi:MAG: ribulose-phosphate 3-epimerase [Chloroflexi bacterium HGW-Chloroflexi-3]|nr:MAG: ribulose-phosphate 3-epimerase [Chloroflexi bacterium HGW-Chloroflexi-3]
MVIFEPSILSADFARLGEQAQEVEVAGAKAIQIDVMDGVFVPNITFGTGVVKALRSLVRMQLDVHLMIVEPERYLQQFIDAGADRLIIHQEASTHLFRTLQIIKNAGIEAGITMNPGTSLSTIEEVLEIVDLVQIMTVNPGFGGQAFLYNQLKKIRRLKQKLDQLGLQIPIAVDGGIDVHTAPLVVDAGATVLIAGSSIFNQQKLIAENLKALQDSVNH